ncbi:zinc finger, CCHC-type containing protein [Tanacetum coccineum]|uniref:Zinc finger, CCHC-type containing protein n=1 Tax=Tanacetum coccineum TaxID=301880 RepID=A0ABQ5HTE7_9ASTR
MWEVFVDGVIYFHAYDYASLDQGILFNFVISFDFKSEKFGEVCLPERLVHTPYLAMAKVNESLGLLEYYDEGGMKDFYSGDTHRGYPDSPPIGYEESSEQNPRAQEPQGRTIKLLD